MPDTTPETWKEAETPLPPAETHSGPAAAQADLAAREAALAAREAELAEQERRFAEKQAAVASGQRPAVDLLRGDPDEKNAKEPLYDKIPLTVRQLDIIIGVCVVLFFVVILLGMDHGALLARLGL